MTGIACQMYTVREFTRTESDLARTLLRLRDIGYTAVQMSAIGAMNGDRPVVTAARARQLLDDAGISCIATHRPWDRLVNELQQEIEFHQALGCDFAAVGSIPAEYRSDGEDGYRRFGAEASSLARRLQGSGIAFGYHNHDFEFERARATGTSLLDALLEGTEPLMLELDVYWAQHAGCDPSSILVKNRGRVPVIHIKDKEVTAETGPVMAPIGEGNLDWAAILEAGGTAGVRWLAVEQDECRRDPFDCLTSSLRYLQNLVPGA